MYTPMKSCGRSARPGVTMYDACRRPRPGERTQSSHVYRRPRLYVLDRTNHVAVYYLTQSVLSQTISRGQPDSALAQLKETLNHLDKEGDATCDKWLSSSMHLHMIADYYEVITVLVVQKTPRNLHCTRNVIMFRSYWAVVRRKLRERLRTVRRSCACFMTTMRAMAITGTWMLMRIRGSGWRIMEG